MGIVYRLEPGITKVISFETRSSAFSKI